MRCATPRTTTERRLLATYRRTTPEAQTLSLHFAAIFERLMHAPPEAPTRAKGGERELLERFRRLNPRTRKALIIQVGAFASLWGGAP